MEANSYVCRSYRGKTGRGGGVHFWPPTLNRVNNFLKDIYSISLKSIKLFYATGDFNLNVLDYNKNERVTKFLNLTFEYGLVPVSGKPSRVTKNTATDIDHITTNSLLHKTINTGIIKLDILDHLLIFFDRWKRKDDDTREKSTNHKTFNKQ